MTDQVGQPLCESNGLGKNFTIIFNDAIRDDRISWRAKGILAGCLSHSNGFYFTRDWIVDHGTEGRDAVISALNELRTHGYLENVKIRNESGRIIGERYRFTDNPRPAPLPEPAPQSDPPVQEPDHRRPENQRPEKPDAGKPGRQRKPIERKPIQEPPLVPPAGRARRCGPQQLELPEWLEPHRGALELWQANRARQHRRAQPGIQERSMHALQEARRRGLLKEFCDYASERTWMSLGFAGYRDLLFKLEQEKGRSGTTNQPVSINYTLQ